MFFDTVLSMCLPNARNMGQCTANPTCQPETSSKIIAISWYTPTITKSETGERSRAILCFVSVGVHFYQKNSRITCFGMIFLGYLNFFESFGFWAKALSCLFEQYELCLLGGSMSDQAFERRARHGIIMEILKSAINGEKKTAIMYKAKLSFAQLEKYLPALEKAGFITQESGIWRTTRDGLHVIDACKICHRLMRQLS